MPKYVMVATANAKPGQEVEFNSWYETYHLPEICDISGVVSGRRLEAVENGFSQSKMHYITIYELETEHPDKVVGEIMRRTQAGEMTQTTSIDPEGASIYFYRQVEAKQYGPIV